MDGFTRTDRSMTPEQMKAARQALGKTQGELAKDLRLGKDGARTVRRWEAPETANNHRAVPGPVIVLIETWLGHSIDELDA